MKNSRKQWKGSSMLEIRTEKISEQRETENVVREAFWNVYTPGCVEPYLAHQMRGCAGFLPELDLVAAEDGKIIGQVMNVKSCISGDDGECFEVVTLGPIAVLPQYQKRGIGAGLIAEVKKLAGRMGCRAIILCGNPEYYAKQGFEPAERYGIRNAENMFADALQVYGLYEGALEGIAGKYFENEIYNVDADAAKKFDGSFLPKELLDNTPSQKAFLEIAGRCRPCEGK
ncbi:GNAT family N-acetyltransferase [Marvinbryantia formatexigens]|uniref:GNAT family N-acetyltransferase n=1 Tax=Marvinbryantia formatexigens TaxID=168384 RepID=UPI001F602EF8|nr:N-acetyltransferase [Marvinbryantia formatexigens]UWO24006.1 N-acetyltransferase [Marvinbryantia formatexigens DSM 14469]